MENFPANVLIANESRRMAVYSAVFFFTCKPAMVIHKGFSLRMFGYSVHDEVAAHKTVSALKGKMSVFLVVEKTRWMGIPPRPRNWLQKLIAKACTVCKCDSVIHSEEEIFSSFLLCTISFLSHPSVMIFFLLLFSPSPPPPPPHHFSNGPYISPSCYCCCPRCRWSHVLFVSHHGLGHYWFWRYTRKIESSGSTNVLN